MIVHGPVDLSIIQSHLKAKATGVSVDLCSMPGRPGKHELYRAELDENDATRLILYWQFQDYTLDRNCLLSGLLPTAAELPRVKSFVDGDPVKGFDRMDLRVAQSMELMLVTDDLKSDFLYVIDGNHRVIAHQLRHLSFQGVSVFVCVHPEMRKWAYIPEYHKQLWKSQR